MLITLTALIPVISLSAASPLLVSTDELQIEFNPRSSEQMRSFYEARGFPGPMIKAIANQCFITVRIHNTGKQRIWLELDRWRFSSKGQPIPREHRDIWRQRWQDMEIPLGSQSTFRWTLLPESLDYLPGEREGGNIILPFTSDPITLEASFATGDDKSGPVINIRYDSLYCAEDNQ